MTPDVEIQPLDYRVDGNATIGTLEAFGQTFEIRVTGPGLASVSGRSSKFSLTNGSGTHFDVEGGTLLVAQQPLSVRSVSVQVDGGPTIAGRWMPSDDAADHQGRLWVIPLPGEGIGLSWTDEQAIAVSWPTTAEPRVGAILWAGSDGSLSWKLAYGPDPASCIVLMAVAGDTTQGPDDCLTWPIPSPVTFEARSGQASTLIVFSDPVVSGEPLGMEVEGRAADGETLGSSCSDFDETEQVPWAGRTLCIAVLPVDAGDVTFRATDPNGRTIPDFSPTLRARPGSLEVIREN